MTDISELIAACRARLAAVTDHPASDPLFDYAVWAVETMPRLLDELEAARRPPLGYAVTVDGPGGRFVQAAPLLREADAVARSRFYANQEARVVELREVQSLPYPSADEMLGADPDWLGGQPVDEYIAEIRGEVQS